MTGRRHLRQFGGQIRQGWIQERQGPQGRHRRLESQGISHEGVRIACFRRGDGSATPPRTISAIGPSAFQMADFHSFVRSPPLSLPPHGPRLRSNSAVSAQVRERFHGFHGVGLLDELVLLCKSPPRSQTRNMQIGPQPMLYNSARSAPNKDTVLCPHAHGPRARR